MNEVSIVEQDRREENESRDQAGHCEVGGTIFVADAHCPKARPMLSPSIRAHTSSPADDMSLQSPKSARLKNVEQIRRTSPMITVSIVQIIFARSKCDYITHSICGALSESVTSMHAPKLNSRPIGPEREIGDIDRIQNHRQTVVKKRSAIARFFKTISKQFAYSGNQTPATAASGRKPNPNSGTAPHHEPTNPRRQRMSNIRWDKNRI